MVQMQASAAYAWTSPEDAAGCRPPRSESLQSNGVLLLPTSLEGPAVFPDPAARERWVPSSSSSAAVAVTRALPPERVSLDPRAWPLRADAERRAGAAEPLVAAQPARELALPAAPPQEALPWQEPDPGLWAASAQELQQQQAQIEELNRKFIRAMELINGVSESGEAQLRSLQARLELRLQEAAPGRLAEGPPPEAAAGAAEPQQELVRVAAALCSDVQALQGQLGRSGGELVQLQELQRQQHRELLELRERQGQQEAAAEASRGHLAGQLREVQGEVRQLVSHVEALQGMCKTGAGDVEVLQEELRAQERQLGALAHPGQLEEALARHGAEVEALRQELGRHGGGVEALRAHHGGELEALRREHAGLAEGLRDLVQGELEAAQGPEPPGHEAAAAAVEALRKELRRELEALQGQLKGCPPLGALDALRQRLQGEVEAVHARLRSDIEDLQGQQAGRWGLLDALQGHLGCQHGGATARAPHARDIETLRSEAREHEREVQVLRRQQQEGLEALRGEQARLLEVVQGQLGASLQAVRRQLEGDIEAVQGRQSESTQGLQELQGQQSACSAGLQALRSQHTRLLTVQEQLIDDVGAIKSQLVDNVRMLQDRGSAQCGLLEALQSNYNKQSGDIEALQSEQKALTLRQSQDFEELKATDIRLNGQIEELRSKQGSLLPPIYQV